MKTGKHSIPVKLVFVRNRNKKSEYIIILTTDCSLSDSEVIRIYGGRWSIEVFFRATKSLLDLGDEFQSLSYDMTVGSTGLVFTRYIILEWHQKRAITLTQLYSCSSKYNLARFCKISQALSNDFPPFR